MMVDYSMRKWYKKPYWFVFRILVRILDRLFIQEHYCDFYTVAQNLHKAKMRQKVSVFKDRIQHTEKYPKIAHDTFNILYYHPKNRKGADEDFIRWLYGIDIIEAIKENYKEHTHIRFIEVNGNNDMYSIYMYTDFMLRPNRHDGASRMRQECEVQGIPYYWTNGTTRPSVEYAINKINKSYAEHKEKTELQRKKN